MERLNEGVGFGNEFPFPANRAFEGICRVLATTFILHKNRIEKGGTKFRRNDVGISINVTTEPRQFNTLQESFWFGNDLGWLTGTEAGVGKNFRVCDSNS